MQNVISLQNGNNAKRIHFNIQFECKYTMIVLHLWHWYQIDT